MQSHPNIDELLTGLLDGNLSEGEVRQVEAAMAVDSTLEKQLETLKKMRSDLLIHRPRGRLGADFAKRITALVENRSLADVALPTIPPLQTPKLRLAPWVYSGALSAAVIACILVMIPSDDKKRPLIANADVPTEIQKEMPGEIPDVGPLKSQLKVTEPLVAKGTTKEPKSPVIKELKETKSLAVVLPTSQNDESQKKEFVVSPNSGANPDTPKVASGSNDKLSNEQIRNNAIAKLDANLLTKNFLTYVVDISLTKSAIENGTFESILSRHGIAMTEKQILTAEELSNLEKTSLASKKAVSGPGEIGLLFIRAPGTNLSQAITDISSDQESFPDFGMDMQMDDSLKLLVNELSSIRVVAESKGEARHLRIAANDSLMSFGAGSKKILPTKRKTTKTGMSAKLSAEGRAMSNALLIIRAANM